MDTVPKLGTTYGIGNNEAENQRPYFHLAIEIAPNGYDHWRSANGHTHLYSTTATTHIGYRHVYLECFFAES